MGGAIACELALRRPDLVTRLVLAEGNLLTGGGHITRYMGAVGREAFRNERLPGMLEELRQGARDGDAVDDFILASWQRMGPGALHDMALALIALRPGLEKEILALGIPRHFIFGGTRLADPEARLDGNLPDPAKLAAAGVIVHSHPDRGHELMLADPAGFAAIAALALSP